MEINIKIIADCKDGISFASKLIETARVNNKEIREHLQGYTVLEEVIK